MPFPLVVNGAQLECTLGAAPGTLVVIPEGPPVTIDEMPVATIADIVPIENIEPFGLCSSLANPEVAAATAAASGVLTPMPCVPVIPDPWEPVAPTVLVDEQPALTALSHCECAWGGVISIVFPGQEQVLTEEA